MTNCAYCGDDLNSHSETKTDICLKKLSKRLEEKKYLISDSRYKRHFFKGGYTRPTRANCKRCGQRKQHEVHF